MILIVDDKSENIFSLKTLLESKGFDVDTASSGEEALRKVLKNSYALIILDVQMPNMNGYEVAEALGNYSQTKDIPIIFLSAVNVNKDYIAKGYDSGAIDYLTKPVDPYILLSKVRILYKLYEQNLQLIETQVQLRHEIEVRKQTQIELRDRVLYLHTILQSLPQIAFKADATGHITFVNNHWYEYSTSMFILPKVFPDHQSIWEIWSEAIEAKTALECEVLIKNVKNNSYRYHLLLITPIIEKDVVRKWVGTFTDIDDQKQVENKKDEFLSIASHELKTPLTSIKGYVQLLARLAVKIENEQVENFVTRTQDQVQKLESLIADLLDVSKISNGKLQMNKGLFDLERLITNVIYTIEHAHRYNKVLIERAGDIFTEQVYGDAIRIEQVLINYLTNAIKYSPGKDRIVLRTKIESDKVIIEVEDFGIGIPEEKQSKVFSKFYRVEESSVSFQGLGIGLYICSEIIKQHKGSYGLKSKLGAGTQIYFSLPIK